MDSAIASEQTVASGPKLGSPHGLADRRGARRRGHREPVSKLSVPPMTATPLLYRRRGCSRQPETLLITLSDVGSETLSAAAPG